MQEEIKKSVGDDVREIHDLILRYNKQVSRIACVLWDQASDLLYTYVNSTNEGSPLEAYKFPLSKSVSLMDTANSRTPRYLKNIGDVIKDEQGHSSWLLMQGYKSSYTVPLYQNKRFLGFIFFNSYLEDAFNEKLQREFDAYSGLIAANITKIQTPVHLITSVVNLRDIETEGHLNRVAAYSHLISSELVRQGKIDDELSSDIFLFSKLHDIGKIAVSESILYKDGPLDMDEFEHIKIHVENGLKLIDKLEDLGILETKSFSVLRNIIAQHHEKLDGSGYPAGLTGNDISIEGRILAICDIFDALTSKRSYKDAWVNNKAFAELRQLTIDGKVDKDLVDILISNQAEINAIQKIFR